jgi:hypothetical protein
LACEPLQRFGPENGFIRIADHALPPEVANLVHNLHGTCSAISQIAAVEDQVGSSLLQVRQDSLKRGPVAVDVGYDSDARQGDPVPSCATISPISQKSIMTNGSEKSTLMKLLTGEMDSQKGTVVSTKMRAITASYNGLTR